MVKKVLFCFLCILFVSCSSPEEKSAAERLILADEFVISMKAGNIEQLKIDITALFKFTASDQRELGAEYYPTRNLLRDVVVISALHLASDPMKSKKVRDAAIFVLFEYMSTPDSSYPYLKRRSSEGVFYFQSGGLISSFARPGQYMDQPASPRTAEACDSVSEWSGLDKDVWCRQVYFSIEQLEMIKEQMIIDYPISYDLKDPVYLKNEICTAVAYDELFYLRYLVSFADFDIGYLRCSDSSYDKNGEWIYGRSEKFGDPVFWYEQYTGEQTCPMSLRRVSGKNSKHKISSRVSQFKNNLKAADFKGADDLDEFRDKFYGAAQGIEGIEGSMNSYLDRSNKWNAGGTCTTDNLLKSGYNLPKGFY